MTPLSIIHARAAARKGGPEELEALLPTAVSAAELAARPDSELLAHLAQAIFSAGFVWKVVENMWPGTTEAFDGFDPTHVASLSDGDLSDLKDDKRVVGHMGKLLAIRDNARLFVETAADHGSFAQFLAEWPADDLVGLWTWLKANGSRIGGMTGPLFLRRSGKDTFMLSKDVVRVLVDEKIVDKAPTSKRALAATQAAFNAWQAESGRPFGQISKILACSVP
jgi:3-methyladenine DNA glycosylase Tag